LIIDNERFCVFQFRGMSKKLQARKNEIVGFTVDHPELTLQAIADMYGVSRTWLMTNAPRRGHKGLCRSAKLLVKKRRRERLLRVLATLDREIARLTAAKPVLPSAFR
jgi:hypothetical protein